MLSLLARGLLVSTSLAPVLVAVAITRLERGESWTIWVQWLGAAVALVVLCHALLVGAGARAQRHIFCIKEFERKDSEVLTFLFIYLLPLIQSEQPIFASIRFTSIYVTAILVLVITHVGAFHFNPVMRLLGYRFYAVKNNSGLSNILISRTDFRRSGKEVHTVRLAQNVHLHIGDPIA